jgi:glycosyltransferase involved in cell wall biosynthesis
MKNIIISVIIIIYNEEKYLKKCILSLLNQSYKNFNLILVNDGSNDKTNKIIKKFKDKRIIYIKKKKNQGYTYARNTGLKYVKTKYVAFTDADCIADKNWLKNGIKYLKKNNKIVSVSGKIIINFSKENKQISKQPWLIVPSIRSVYYYPTTMNCIIKTKIIKKFNGFNIRYNIGSEDVDLGLKICHKYKIGYNKKMIIYHQNKKLTIKRGISLIQRIPSQIYILKDYNIKFPKLIKYFTWNNIILSPHYFISIFFPPYLIYYIFIKNNNKISLKNLLMLIPIYFGLIYMRLIIWKTAIKEKYYIL